jgi:hypothetical protein
MTTSWQIVRLHSRRLVRFLKSGLDRASNFYWRGGMLLCGLTNIQRCFDALD